MFHSFFSSPQKLILINNIILDTNNILLKERVQHLKHFGCCELYDQQFSYMRANLWKALLDLQNAFFISLFGNRHPVINLWSRHKLSSKHVDKFLASIRSIQKILNISLCESKIKSTISNKFMSLPFTEQFPIEKIFNIAENQERQ